VIGYKRNNSLTSTSFRLGITHERLVVVTATLFVLYNVPRLAEFSITRGYDFSTSDQQTTDILQKPKQLGIEIQFAGDIQLSDKIQLEPKAINELRDQVLIPGWMVHKLEMLISLLQALALDLDQQTYELIKAELLLELTTITMHGVVHQYQ
jgi:hypothetical protein